MYRQLLLLAVDDRERVQERARASIEGLFQGPRGKMVQSRTSKASTSFLVQMLRGSDSAKALASASLGNLIAKNLTETDACNAATTAIEIASKNVPVLSTAALELLPSLILSFESGPVDEEDMVRACTL